VALGGQLVADLLGVDEVAVVAQAQGTAPKRDGERLRAGLVHAPRGGVANVADARAPAQGLDVPLVEGVADESHLDVVVLLEPVVGDDARRLLSAVLERVQRVVEGARGVPLGERDPDDAALLGRTRQVRATRTRFGGRWLARLGVLGRSVAGRVPAVWHGRSYCATVVKTLAIVPKNPTDAPNVCTFSDTSSYSTETSDSGPDAARRRRRARSATQTLRIRSVTPPPVNARPN